MLRSVLDDLDEELEHLFGRDLEAGGIGGEAERGDRCVGPMLELLFAIGGDAEHLGDDSDGEWVCQVADEIGTAVGTLLDHLGDELLGDLADPRLVVVDHPRRETSVDEASHGRVEGRVGGDE